MLIRPRWAATSTPSTTEGRRNGNQPPPAEPIFPSDFVVHLYAPDQQVHVRQKQGSWVGSTGSWEFELPQNTFRQPSASDLDRSQNDPAAAETTPRYRFRWKRDGKLSRDLICRLSGRSNDPAAARKKKKSTSTDPDIAVALFRQQREITLYEPNLSRIEIEDPKGFEVVTLLSAIVIRDVFLGNVREAFNLSTSARRAQLAEEGSADITATARTRAISLPTVVPAPAPPAPVTVDPAVPSISHGWEAMFPSQHPTGSAPPHSHPHPYPRPDPPPPWRSTSSPHRPDHETATSPARTPVEPAELNRIEKMLEAERKNEARRRQAEVDRETERLRRLYGQEEKLAAKHLKPSSSSSSSSSSTTPKIPTSPALQSGPPSSTSLTRPASTPAGVAAGGDEGSGFVHPLSLNPSHKTAIAARAHGDGHLCHHHHHTTSDTHSGRTIYSKRSIFGLRSRSHDVDPVKLHK